MTDLKKLIAKQVYYQNWAHQLMTDVRDLRKNSDPHLDTLYWAVFRDDAQTELSFLRMMQSNLFVEGIMVRRAIRFQKKADRLDNQIQKLVSLAGAGLINVDISTLNETRDEVILSSSDDMFDRNLRAIREEQDRLDFMRPTNDKDKN